MDPEEQESQVVTLAWEVSNKIASYQNPHQDHDSEQQTGVDTNDIPGSDDTIDDPQIAETGQESHVSFIDEKQLIRFEQDSCASRVGETQLIGLEFDTQALEDVIGDSPTTQRVLQQINARNSAQVPTNIDNVFPFSRPKGFEPEGLPTFKFSVAAKPIAGQFKMTPGMVSEPKLTESCPSVSVPQPKAISEWQSHVNIALLISFVQFKRINWHLNLVWVHL